MSRIVGPAIRLRHSQQPAMRYCGVLLSWLGPIVVLYPMVFIFGGSPHRAAANTINLLIIHLTLAFVFFTAAAVGSWAALRTPLETHALAAEPDRRDLATLRPLPPVTPWYWFAWGALGALGALAALGTIVYFVVELLTEG